VFVTPQTPLAVAWSDAFLKAMLDMPIAVSDLASADKELYDTKVAYLRDGRYKEDEMEVEDLRLSFVDESNGEDYMAEDEATRLPGAPVELKEGGKDIGAFSISIYFFRFQIHSDNAFCRADGAGVPAAVTEANKAEYLQLLVEHRLIGAIKEQVKAFCTGLAVFLTDEVRSSSQGPAATFAHARGTQSLQACSITESLHRWIPPLSVCQLDMCQVSATLRRCCTVADLQLMLCGCRDLDVADWRAHTDYVGLSTDADLVNWFWAYVGEMSEAEKARLLVFATGSPRVAAAG
jgi:hypothetical protein